MANDISKMSGRFFKGFLRTRFGNLESEKIITMSLKLEKIGSLESDNRAPTGPYWVRNIFLKKKPVIGLTIT